MIQRILASPEFIVFALAAIGGAMSFLARGAKAQFRAELEDLIVERFSAHEKVEQSHDEAVSASIAALQEDVGDLKVSLTEVRSDVREIARDVKTIMSNGYFKK